MKLLYITFIDLNTLPTTGSSVRPQKINRAFEELNIEIETIDGINNNFSKRKKAVAQAKGLLKTWKPDMCYIEPPSGPMFYHGDVRLIKLLHKKKIPTAIFYRDAYWKYPEYAQEKKTVYYRMDKAYYYPRNANLSMEYIQKEYRYHLLSVCDHGERV